MSGTRPFTLRAADGQRLGGDAVSPRSDPRGIAILLPAMMVDWRAFRGVRGLPGVLADDGWEVWCADFRGHGASPRARWTYDELVQLDVPALIAAARAATAGPVVVVGHSLGGHVVLASAAEGHLADAYVLLAANVWMPSLDAHRGRRCARALVIRAFLAASESGAFPSRHLRVGPSDECADYVGDLVRFWRTDSWRSRDGFDWYTAAQRLRVPILAITGAGDRLMAHHVGARAFADLVPTSEFRVVGRRTGLAFDPGHMALVTDARSQPVWLDVARWLRRV